MSEAMASTVFSQPPPFLVEAAVVSWLSTRGLLIKLVDLRKGGHGCVHGTVISERKMPSASCRAGTR